ncbi:DUF4142 domain-containing protein [Azorhizobium doebereinerae]|uniref:DUF4142 domain-containing protein n=1 Tax=Azorhizobium doebereinerae TaxID=281091 RepID=UPI0003FE6731|nr:DUF4142 domain-containing protein [Azorhizobium doebereinerae]
MLTSRTNHMRAAAFALLFALAALFVPQMARAQLSGTLSGPRFVETAAVAGLFEIESSKIALERSDNPGIKAFAQMMVDDHTRIAAALKRAAADANGEITIPAALDSEHDAMIRKLKTASGREFDALYVQMQTTGHEQAVGLFGAYAKDGDQTALKTFAADTLPTLQNHLKHVMQIQVKT